MAYTLIVRYSEITLKGRNRSRFERQLVDNIRNQLKPLGSVVQAQLQPGRVVLRQEEDPAHAIEILRHMPGVANISLARIIPRDYDTLVRAAGDLMEEALAKLGALPPLIAAEPGVVNRWVTFRIRAERKDKAYPIPSLELEPRLGAAMLARFPQLKVRLDDPEITIRLEIWPEGAALYTHKEPGPEGLAVGSSGRALCLLSGGIDSPVAAYMMMTRGCPVSFINFHSFPYIGEQSKEKIRDIARFMARFQPRTTLYVAPFAAYQEAVRDHCPEGLRTVLYRRQMNRVACALARQEGLSALVTGDQLGQVASQTMENLTSIWQTADLPVLSPLIGMGKSATIRSARAIGTYGLSIQPFPDCCTLFQPTHPDTRVKAEAVAEAESALDIPGLTAQCLSGMEVITFGAEYYPAEWQ